MTLWLSGLKFHIVYMVIGGPFKHDRAGCMDALLFRLAAALATKLSKCRLDQTPRKRLQQRQSLQDILVLILVVHLFKAEFFRWIGSIKFPQYSKKLTACTGYSDSSPRIYASNLGSLPYNRISIHVGLTCINHGVCIHNPWGLDEWKILI